MGRELDKRGRVIQAGNAPHVKTDRVAREVERMVFLGLDVSEISYCLGLSINTLQQQYSDELENGGAMLVNRIGGAPVKQALRGDTNAAQFLLRARARWVTPTKQEIDANVTIQDKRKVKDEILALVRVASQKKIAPITIDAQPVGKPS